MTTRLLPIVLLAALVAGSGCMFSKKNPRAKEGSAIAADVEETFHRRWMDKRVGELVAQGTAADAARTQAEAEFREKYGFDQNRKK